MDRTGLRPPPAFSPCCSTSSWWQGALCAGSEGPRAQGLKQGWQISSHLAPWKGIRLAFRPAPRGRCSPPPTRALVPVEVFSLLFSLFFSSGFSLVKSRAASSLTAHSVICAMVIALRTSVSPLEIRTIVPASQVAIWITFNRLRQRDGIVWQK